jgi:hypothetical protein
MQQRINFKSEIIACYEEKGFSFTIHIHLFEIIMNYLENRLLL